MREAVIFDLGNTLVEYWPREKWPEMLEQAIAGAAAHLRGLGRPVPEAADLAARVKAERGEREDLRVNPLEERLVRIFGLDAAAAGVDLAELCRCFMRPLFAVGRLYPDALPALAEIRRRGLRTGILSNTAWGSPAELWREEVARLGLRDAVHAVVFCTDVGWRKPAPQPFERIVSELGVAPSGCLFVGDDPRWDVRGATDAGMEARLIDRTGASRSPGSTALRSLSELLEEL